MISSRRNFLHTMLAGSAAFLPGALEPSDASGAKQPNVLFIAVDDLNDWVGCLGGHPDSRTPNLDRLASRGMLFTKAYCPAPLCNPSRAALMTGIRPSTSGVYANAHRWRGSPALQNAVTIPQHFMAHGYEALGSGKIYHDSFPDPPSWQEYWPSKTQPKPEDPLPEGRPLNGIPNTAHFDWGPLNVPDGEMGDRQVADWVSGQLGTRHERPFFLACGFFKPHLPWFVPPKYFDRFPAEKITLPYVKEDDLADIPPAGRKMARPEGDHANVLKYGQWQKAVQAYLASISFMDDCLGRVIDAFDKSPHRDNTIIILWSDHGWHLGEKLHWRKFSLWEEATRNVLLFAAPGITKPGQRCDATVNLIDIYPTLIDLCGLAKKPELEGVSLLPLLRNPKAKWDLPALTTYGRNNHSVRSDRWRYIRYADGSEELYDHYADDMEWTNLAGNAKYTEVKRNLAGFMPKKNVEEIKVK
ncbi:MAG: sulfatase [Candidatus Latescibacterota bacterium]